MESDQNHNKHQEEPQLPVGHGLDAGSGSESTYKTIALEGMYQSWFLDYASYVILERAVPDVLDGLKPVHRRILHAMREMDDGRYNKVANIIGQTMKYHPHGDASIGDALVQLGQKELLIDTQGNWGNTLTGDSAAAPRYIEARLSKFALEVVFNPKTTEWRDSYDGRNKEPVALPVKFPLLLAQGVEGIAVGLASKIVPHNFNELIEASIRYLQGKEFEILPDFLSGGMADFSKYNNGLRGGKIRIRAKIQQTDKKALTITEIPFGTTTTSLIESIVAANDKGKIKIKKIDDNTSDQVEIQIQLVPGVSPDQTIDALYAFTNCEVSVSPNSCVIYKGKPHFMGVDEILRISTDDTVRLLRRELEIQREELEEQWHFASLEKIFIQERIYRDIEESETWEAVITTIDSGLEPFKKLFKRAITRDDIIRLTEIKIKRISKYNAFKADEQIRNIETNLEEVQNHLDNLIDYAINYFRQIRKKYGKDRERRTEIRSFDTIEASLVAVANAKLYINREEGFAGTSLKKDEFVCDCSDIDDIIFFRDDGTFMVTRASEKFFTGKNVIHIEVFKRNDERTIYNMIYRDGRGGNNYVKRFAVVGVTRDKDYNLTRGTEGTRVLYFSANPNGEAEIVRINLRPKPRLKITAFDYDFSTLAIKGRGSKGNTLSKHFIRKIVKKEEGISTLGAIDVWFDPSVKRLNNDQRGNFVGAFEGDNKILALMQSGDYRLIGFDLSAHFDEDLLHLEKYDPDTIITAVYLDGNQNLWYIKRFKAEETDKKTRFISEHPQSKLITVTTRQRPVLQVMMDEKKNEKQAEDLVIVAEEFIGEKSYKAKGKRLTNLAVKKVKWLEPLPADDEPEDMEKQEVEQPEQHENIAPAGIEKTKVKPEKAEITPTPPPPLPRKTSGKTKPDQPQHKKEKDAGGQAQMSLFD
ncbi:MAG: DNA gyrase/topoisomerase IV subunit A [Bacteroidales bacterium]|jgi:topoisomerase-4 subunit A|nr:DNA gyrase/topoisomerase IV subunit A [Bacteroidales bacterium]NCU34697.1 DNA gyrase/topoisomerase IV subunit A [Candidatus Falkowbacteria bacterium]MDD2633438.1 DNA gyrase/topoisomerase IV subunit A [Bacteroidales bacterium]MDD4178156.1 DNA gyrase/topoisomerase IV subunit A [Bacteroidales bacterium]MDD4740066.1 DNA gyrase/topoisomerase IV subunit A [Bacteroidales bacterium]